MWETFRDDFGPVGAADPYVVSGWVKDKLGAVTSVTDPRSGIVLSLCFLRPKAGGAAHHTFQLVSCFALWSRTPLKGVTGRGGSVEKEYS